MHHSDKSQAQLLKEYEAARERLSELEKTEKRYRTLFEGIADGIIIHDVHGAILDVNHVTCERLGYTAEALRGMHLKDILSAGRREDIGAHVDEVLGQQTVCFETEYLSRDGRCIACEVIERMVDYHGRKAIQSVARDITERKRAEEDRMKLEERLRHSEKMQAIGQLAGGIAHDFNNQLTGINGYAGILKARLKDAQLRGYAEMIGKAAARASGLTRQLLAFARRGKSQSVPVNVHGIIGEVIALLAPGLDKRIKVSQQLEAHPPTILGDPTELQNALLNIAINARDAMPEGGEMVFATESAALGEEDCRPYANKITPGRFLRISIRDTGIGMDRDVLNRIFEPFFTTKKEGQGTGMGLAAVYGTVRSHKGVISVTSKPGQGSDFTILLPLTEVADDASQAKPDEVPKTVGAHILVVDDEKVAADLLAHMVRDLGYSVTTCRSGGEAVEHYRASWKHIDLVVLDVMMPDLGGLDVFMRMREINPQVKVMLTSGYGIDGKVQAALDDGALSFLPKPLNVSDLARELSEALGAYVG